MKAGSGQTPGSDLSKLAVHVKSNTPPVEIVHMHLQNSRDKSDQRLSPISK